MPEELNLRSDRSPILVRKMVRLVRSFLRALCTHDEGGRLDELSEAASTGEGKDKER